MSVHEDGLLKGKKKRTHTKMVHIGPLKREWPICLTRIVIFYFHILLMKRTLQGGRGRDTLAGLQGWRKVAVCNVDMSPLDRS